MPAPAPPPGFTLDEPRPPLPPGFTFDDALAARQSQMRPGGNLDVRTGEELIPGQGLPGAPNYQRPMVAPAPEAAPASNFGAALKSKLVEDEGTKVRLVAESLGIDPARVGIVEGRPVFVNDEGKLQLVSGPWSRGTAGAIANAPEAVLGGLGSVSGSPIIGGTLGAVGGRGLKRGLAGLITGEPQTVSGNLTDLAIEGGISALSAGAGRGAVAFAGRKKITDFTPAQIKTAEQSRAYIKAKTGIDLDLAQASGDRALIGLRDYAARYPGKTAQILQARDEITAGQLDVATNRVLDMVAKAKPAELTGKEAIGAAQAVIATLKAERDAAVDPFYAAARKVVVGADVVESLASDPLIRRAAKRIAADPVYQRKLKGLPENSVGYWQQVKRNLNAGYDRSSRAGDRTAASEYTDAADIVNKRLAAVSPEYALANQHYARATRDIVTPTEDSLIGVLAKMHPKNAQLAARIFNDPGVTPEQIAVLKGGMMRSNPDAYRGLVRQWLGGKYNQAMKQTQGGDTINPAGKFRQAVMGTPNDEKKARAMLPTDALDAFDDLMTAAERLARTPLGASRVAGSNTARDQLITEQLKGRALGTLRWLMFPRQSIQDAAEQRVMESSINELTEALVDPLKRAQLKQITRMKPSTAQAIRLGTFLSGQGVKTAADDMTKTQLPQAPYQ